MFGHFAALVLRLISNLFLTRLLLPEAFGLMSLVNVFFKGLKMFSDVGVVPAIVQSREGDDVRFLNTAWSIQIIRGLAIFAVSCVIARPLATFYGEGVIALLVPMVGVSAVVLGFESTKIATASKHVRLGRVTIIALTSQVVGLAVMCAAAWFMRSVWVLVLGGLISAVCQAISSHMCLPGPRNWLLWDWKHAASLARFGKWIFVSTALTFLAAQGDRLVLGRLFSMEMLGVYSVAWMLAEAPRALLTQLGTRVIFPTVSKRSDLTRSQLRELLQRHRQPLVYLMMVVVAIMATGGDLVVEIMWDERYHNAAWMFPLLSFGIWPRVLDQSSAATLLAIRRLQYNPIGSALKIAVILFFLPKAHFAYGAVGAIFVIAASEFPSYFVNVTGMALNGLGQVRQDAIATALFFFLILGLWGLRAAIGIEPPALTNKIVEMCW